MSLHIFGIRHHGPGSSRSLRQALETLQPDAILVEGPPEANKMLPLLVHPEMQPPVALLVYVPDQPHRAVYYPFAVFSPEWQALNYGLTSNIPVRFMDLPQAHQFGLTPPAGEDEDLKSQIENPTAKIHQDPLGCLAEAAGYSDGERWWEHMVEQRQDSVDLFDAILEAIAALRQETPTSEDPLEAQREAYMRQTIRAAQKEGFERIAVVCGAWHAPALSKMPPAKEDAALLKGLPKTKVEVTWVPWTYGRLSYYSGYGAGVESPGWYHHLWEVGEESSTDADLSRLAYSEKNPKSKIQNPKSDVAIRWMTRVARLLRDEDLDASSAHVIEAVRLAEAMAALRDRPLPGLPELNDATQTVFCFGSDLPMRLIHHKLIVGERLGEVPDETPMVPLQQDLKRQQKSLRMPAEAFQKTIELDLRKPNDLEKSHLLHRLRLLLIAWGEPQEAAGKGTFKERWLLQWQPEFAVKLIEAGLWGNTVYDAATACAVNRGDKAAELPTLTELLDKVLLADLPDAIAHLMMRLQAAAAVASDVAHLMEALPPLANILRYGNVRKSDTRMVSHIVDGLVARICIGVPGACASLDDDAAEAMRDRLNQVNDAILLLQNTDYLASWQQTLTQIADRHSIHALLAGRSCRILLDSGAFVPDEAARRMGLALSTANEPAQAAAWVEGFIKGSGLLLLLDDKLWQILDSWVAGLSGDTFTALLPLLRRTFSTFSAPERRQMGEKVRRKDNRPLALPGVARDMDEFDSDRANAVLPIIAQLLGVS